MSRRTPLIVAFFILLTAFFSCGLIPNLGCDLKLTNEYIESSCGLHNGVRFEQLQVDTFYLDNTPKKYRVVLAFEGQLKDSIYKKQIDRIYSNHPQACTSGEQILQLTDYTINGAFTGKE